MPDTISLTQENLQDIYGAFDHFFPSGAVYSRDKPYSSREFNWKNRADFIDFISRLTGIKIASEKDIKAIKDAQQKIGELVGEPAPKPPEQPSSTVPNKEKLATLQEEVERKKQKDEAIRATVKQRSAAEYVYLKAEKIKTAELDEKTVADFQARVIEAKKNPTAYNDKLAQEIYESHKATLPPEQLEQLKVSSKIVATNFTEKLVSIEPTETLPIQLGILYSQSPIHALASLANPNDPDLIKLIPDKTERLEFCRAAQNLTLIQAHDNILARNLLSKILPENLVKILYPEADNLMPMTVSENQNDSHYTVNRQQLINSYHQTSPILDSIKNEAGSKLQSYSLKFIDKSLSHLPWYSKIRGVFGQANISIAGSSLSYESGILAFFSTKGIPILAPDLAGMLATEQFSSIAISSAINFRMGTFAFSRAILGEGGKMVGQAFGINLGNYAIRLTSIIGKDGLTKIALNIGTKAAVEAAVKAGTEVPVAAALATTLSTIFGSFAPVIGHAIGAFIGWLVGKVGEWIVNFVKQHKDWFKYLGLGLVAAGGFLGLWPLAAFGGLMFLGALGIGGIAAGLGSVASVGMRTLGFFGSVAVSISTTAIIILLSFPVIVALILFIINSGAYIVPPKISTLTSSTTATIISPYIDVSKVADPAGPFQNSDLPLTIKYTIIITAKKGSLTNIQIAYDCKVVKEKSSPACPTIAPDIPTGNDIPTSISPTQPYSFEYTQVIKGSSYNDSLISDTITVTADESEQVGAKAAASLGIKIGNPPDTCPSGWPVDGSYEITQGPNGGFSHVGIEAIDIGVGMGTPVKATHSGVAHVVYTSGAYRPVYVDISSNCGGAFSSRYAHLSVVNVKDGQIVTMGEVIGLSGSDGTGPHLHYEFIGLKMAPPNIPKSVPYGCSDNCGQIP